MMTSHLAVLSSQLPLVVAQYATPHLKHEHQSFVVVHVAIYLISEDENEQSQLYLVAFPLLCGVCLTSLSLQLSLHPLCTEIEYDWICLDCVSFAFVDETFATIVYSFRFFC